MICQTEAEGKFDWIPMKCKHFFCRNCIESYSRCM